MIDGMPVSDAVIEAVARAMFHFLWQGSVLGLAAWCLLYVARSLSSHARYAVLCGTLAAMAVCPAITFFVVIETAQPAATTHAPQSLDVSTGSLVDSNSHAASDRGSALDAASVSRWLSRHAEWLVSAWFIGAGCFLARLLAAAVGLRTIKRRGRAIPADLLPFVNQTLERLEFGRQPQLRIVDGISQAMATGLLKPMVLLPAAWIAELPPDVLEVVIAHELAHLRRWDLAINALQRCVECVLFFHPAMWWCSRQIRMEREICCDAMALRATSGRLQVAKALTHLAARRAPYGTPLIAAGIGGPQMILLRRIRELLNVSPSAHSRFYGPCCAGLGAAAASLFWLGLVAVLEAAPTPAERPGVAIVEPGSKRTAAPDASRPGEANDGRAVLGMNPHTAASLPAPREGRLVSLPAYTIEPPDILSIELARTVPKQSYRIQAGDVLNVLVDLGPVGTSAGGSRTKKLCVVSPSGMLDLGFPYGERGRVKVAGLSAVEAASAIEASIRRSINFAKVSVELSQSASLPAVNGEHLVSPDGRVNLGKYGQVYVAGMTLPATKSAIQAQLAKVLEAPEVTVGVYAYNSKVYYVICPGAALGDTVHRFPITGNETVLDALTQISGFRWSATTRIWIARPTPGGAGRDTVLPVNWREITEGSAIATNYQLLPGDRLFVTDQSRKPAGTKIISSETD